MKYGFYKFYEIAEEIKKNHERYFSEINDKTEDYVLDVDWDCYNALSQAGHLYAAVMANEDGLQGHMIFSVTEHPRHRGIWVANGESVHVERAFRGGEAKALESIAINSLRLLGVREVSFTWSDKRQGEWLNKLGYEPSHTVWTKKLGEYNGK